MGEAVYDKTGKNCHIRDELKRNCFAEEWFDDFGVEFIVT